MDSYGVWILLVFWVGVFTRNHPGIQQQRSTVWNIDGQTNGPVRFKRLFTSDKSTVCTHNVHFALENPVTMLDDYRPFNIETRISSIIFNQFKFFPLCR